MSSQLITPPYSVYQDKSGQPLSNGYIYIGKPNLNPQTTPVSVYFNEALTVPATQPIRTIGGYPSQNGSPARLFVSGDYSIAVRDRNKTLVYSSSSNILIDYVISDELPWVDVLSFNDGAYDSNSAIEAINSLDPTKNYVLLFRRGNWAMDGFTSPENVIFMFEAGAIFNIANGQIITYEGPSIIAPKFKIFNLIGTGKITFLSSAIIGIPQYWGAIGDGIINDSSAFVDMLASGIATFDVPKKTYSFGSVLNGQTKLDISSDMTINWNWSKIEIAGPTGSGDSATFINATDCTLNMANYTFEDTNFSYGTGSRGVSPIVITNAISNTKNYSFGPFNIIAGQSMLTAVSSDPVDARASDIAFVGSCTGGTLYYGVNLAGNGDNFSGNYSIDQCYRPIFAYGVSNVDVDYFCDDSLASSASLNLSAVGGGMSRIGNININARYNLLNGYINLVALSSAEDDGDGFFENIKINVYAKVVGSNITNSIVRVGQYDSGGNFDAFCTTTVKKLQLSVSYDTIVNVNDTTIMAEGSSSTNYGLIYQIGGKNIRVTAVPGFHVKVGNKFYRGIVGDTTAISLYLNPTLLFEEDELPKNRLINGEIKVASAASTAFAGQAASVNLNEIKGYLTTTDLVLTGVVTIYESFVTTDIFVEIVENDNLIQISADGYASNPNGYIIAEYINYVA